MLRQRWEFLDDCDCLFCLKPIQRSQYQSDSHESFESGVMFISAVIHNSCLMWKMHKYNIDLTLKNLTYCVKQ